MSVTDVVCSNGVVLKCDLTIKAGDIITGYRKGYWKVDLVMPRAGNTPLIYSTRIDKKGKNSCDGSYCRKVDPEVLYRTMVDEAEKIRAMIYEALYG